MKNARLVALLLVSSALIAVGTSLATPRNEEWGGGRTVPVHRLPLVDENNVDIYPPMKNAAPFSTRTSCGICHDYKAVQRGWHFNSSLGVMKPGRPGEPWIWVDQLTGTQLPLSYRGWPNTWKPDAIGMDAWDFTKTFGRNLPGGDMAEPPDVYDDPHSRWTVSGVLEIDCLGCHSGSIAQDHTEWVKQIGRQNFRWAGTAASGFGEVGGMASRIWDTWIPLRGPNPDDTEFAVPPFVKYHLPDFDRKNRVIFDVRKPMDQRCFTCHSTHVGELEKTEIDGDVHTVAGIRCVDCHRSNLDHQDVRAYETEAEEMKQPWRAAFTCKECHLGDAAHDGGRLRAPRPKHKGLPPIHFEKLSCTACHSGPTPGKTPQRVRTSRSNRLDIYGRAVWYTDAPFIEEPIMAEAADGKITPHRIMWPAFWGRKVGEKITPLRPDELAKVATGLLDPEQQLGRVLKALGNDPEQTNDVVFVANGKSFSVTNDGGLTVKPTTSTMTGWMRQDPDGKLIPLITDFDPKAEKFDADANKAFEIEKKLLSALQALGSYDNPPGDPVLARGKKLYQRDPNGALIVVDGATEYTAATWGWLKDGKVLPFVPDFVIRAIVETTGTEHTFTEEQLGLMLKVLAAADKGAEFVYVGRGKLFRLGADGKVSASDSKLAEPTLWPIGHDVRPARASLGAKSCNECHSPDAWFFTGNVIAAGPLKTDHRVAKQMHEFEKLDMGFERLFGQSFLLRPIFKGVLWIASLLIGAVVLALLLRGLHELVLLRAPGKLPGVEKLAWLAVWVSFVVLVITGFSVVLLNHPLVGFPLLAHTGLGGLFGVSLAVLAILRAEADASCGQKLFFWLLVLSGLVLMLTAALMMLPLAGTGGQFWLLHAHRTAAWVALVAGVFVALQSRASRGAAKKV